MKKILFCLLMLTISLAAFAQTRYRVTATTLNVRTGPGTNYGCMHYPETDVVIQFDKGAIVCSKGAARNGFLPVEVWVNRVESKTGWVSLKYVTPAKKCTACKGSGQSNRVCPSCNGRGAYVCCWGSGYAFCSKCGGKGYY